jgi:uncharacterized protein YceH (UPF0502 family)
MTNGDTKTMADRLHDFETVRNPANSMEALAAETLRPFVAVFRIDK